MTDITTAAAELAQEIYEQYELDWLQGVAIGGDELFIYLKKRTKNQMLTKLAAEGWHGYPVIIKYVGPAKPAAA